MQLHTDHMVGRPMFRPQPTQPSRGYARPAQTLRPAQDLRPAVARRADSDGPISEGMSTAELRRIVAEVLG